MSRPRYTFRPSLQRDSHRKAWEALQSVPKGQRNEFLVRAILWMQEDAVLEETLRRILREELQAFSLQTGPPPEVVEQSTVSEPGAAPPIPQEMMAFLDGLLRED